MSTSSTAQQQDADDLDVGDNPLPDRLGRSAEPEDFNQRGRGRKSGGRPALEAGAEIKFWPQKGVCVPANVVRAVKGETIDLVYRHGGQLRTAESVEHRAGVGGWSWPAA